MAALLLSWRSDVKQVLSLCLKCHCFTVQPTRTLTTLSRMSTISRTFRPRILARQNPTVTWRPSPVSCRFLLAGSSKSGKDITKNLPISWRSVGITCVLAGVFWAGMMYVKAEKDEAIKKERQKQIGKAKIGGEYELTDHNGKLRTSQDFHGSWILLYFGFTHCPDICPDEIEKLLKTADIIETRLPDVKIQRLFITVDPDRDSVEAVGRYVKEFSPKLLGLTGTKEQITKVAKAFRVYFSAAPADEDNDYIVDHTIIIYFIDPEGKFVDYYGQNKTAEQMADHIESYVERKRAFSLW